MPARGRVPHVLVTALGDSISAGSPEYDPSRGGDETSQWEFWAARADPRLSFRNCGVYGERTDEIRARLDGCVTGADALVVQGGINDIAQGRLVDEPVANLRAMVVRGKELGLRVALADVLPWNNGRPEHLRAIQRLNVAISAIARGESVPLLPFHDTLVDERDPRRMREEWTHADGDHPSVAGYRRLGEAAARLL